jgi:hypothetical protein
MILRGKKLHPSGGGSLEPAVLKIGLPIIGLHRGLAARLRFKEGPQHEIRGGKFEEWDHTKSALVGLDSGERSPTLPNTEDGALVSVR